MEGPEHEQSWGNKYSTDLSASERRLEYNGNVLEDNDWDNI